MHLSPVNPTPDAPVEAVPSLPTGEPQRPYMSVPVRSFSLAVLALLGVLYTLHWASAVIVPVLLGLMLSHALGPRVDRLERLRLPRALAAALLLLSLVGSLGWTV